MVIKLDYRASVPMLERRLFFAFLLPFTCDFAIYSPCFVTARHGAVFGGTGVRIRVCRSREASGNAPHRRLCTSPYQRYCAIASRGGELAHAVGIALNQLHLLFLRYEWSPSAIVASLTHPRTSRSWNTLGRSRVDVYQELALVVTIIEQFDHEGRVPGHGEMIFGQ